MTEASNQPERFKSAAIVANCSSAASRSSAISAAITSGADKRIRFGDLVRNSGRPQVVTLWTKPEENRVLTDAVKKNRVLTVMQEPRKRDYGMIGFEPKPGALFLIFPRPLPRERTARVVGINYQLVEEPVVQKARTAKVAATSRSKA
jgi:hypothetical protein